jgi:hypothetical protein
MTKAALRPTTKKPTATIPEMIREYQTCFRAGEKFAEQADGYNRADRQMCKMIERCDMLQDRILAAPAATPDDLAVKRRFVEECVSIHSLDPERTLDVILQLDAAHLRAAAR